MTPLMEYRQAKNQQSRKYGGDFHCPDCGSVLDLKAVTYYCPTHEWSWDYDGEPITKEKK